MSMVWIMTKYVGDFRLRQSLAGSMFADMRTLPCSIGLVR